MRKELQILKDFLMENNPIFVEIVNETKNMTWQEIAALYDINTECINEQAIM